MRSYSHDSATSAHPTWTALLQSAITQPGTVSSAFRQFHTYSIGNQLLAFWQCKQRAIQPGPIATFVRWKELKRYVRRGEKAITLCMPVTCKGAKPDDQAGDTDIVQAEPTPTFTRFVYRPHWFVLAQTEGDAVEPEPIPEWDSAKALANLDITPVPFTLLDGNVQGYARAREIAVNPLTDQPHATTFHEMAHVLLGHTTEGAVNSDTRDRTPRDIRELEAECVALLCLESLTLPGADQCRGYIQSWFHAREVPERSAQRILHVADEILKAGMRS